MSNDTKNIIIPSNPADLKKLRGVIDEMTNSMTREDGEKQLRKDILESAEKDFEIPAKYIRQMAKDAHKDLFNKKVDEFDDYTTLYESVMKLNNQSSTADDESEEDW